ncbi:MAG: hypothetical protein IJZ00_10350 [Lachnospiraceae bacterium]|nr:hypothetical protein [Lachnospiraceae bacterium]MBQ8262675.1 hypothetical protein [Lachnospiraceae bacterium]
MSSGRKHPKYENITSRWGGMKIREDFAERIDKWLQAFPKEEHAFLLELLMQFYYYSEERIKDKVVELYDAFIKTYHGDATAVVYTKIIKEQGVACSDVLFSDFWLQNDLMYSCSDNNILGLLEAEQIPKELAVVDDYSGTGKSFIKTVDKMLHANELVQDTNFYFLTLHITERAIRQINEYAKEVGINIKIVSLDCSDEAFKKNYIYNEVEAERKKRQYAQICINQNMDKYVLGFEDVSSLVAFHYNTPNNTLGLFWQDLMDFSALFPRKKKKRTELSAMQKNARNRKREEEPPVIYGIEDGKMAVMLVYCLGQPKGIFIDDFATTFGLTAIQADKALREMIEQGYMFNESGCFQPTAKLKSHVFMSRIKKGQKRFKEVQEEQVEFRTHEEYIPCNFK